MKIRFYTKAAPDIVFTKNPAMTPNVPTRECSPKCASGINIIYHTYIMIPAATDNNHGIIGKNPYSRNNPKMQTQPNRMNKPSEGFI